MPITTTVTWQDLQTAHDDELADLRDAYDELREKARAEYGDDALTQDLPTDPDNLSDDERALYVYQQKVNQYDSAAQSIQKRQHILGQLADEYGDGAFELKMLTGTEMMDVEAELRMEAQQRDVSVDVIQVKRNALTVDAATVDAPEGIPREDGSPVPSACPNALTLALWEQVERFNSAGATDFRPVGFGEDSPAPTPTGAKSATPTASSEPSASSAPTDES